MDREQILNAIAESRKVNEQVKQAGQETQVEDPTLVKGIGRAAFQGLTFGFGDEIEAIIDSIGKDKTYDQAIKEVRAKIKRFRETNPVAAYGSEIAGSIPTAFLPGAVAGRAIKGGTKLAEAAKKTSRVKKATKTGAIQGGIYGVGAGEGVEGRAVSGTVGAIGGGVLGGISAKVLPKTTEKAKALMEKDIRVTPGQAFGGEGNIVGNVLRNFEQSTSSLVGVGDPIQMGRITALADFNRSVIKEALEPITGKLSNKEFNNLIPKNLTGTQLFQAADDFVTRSYSDELAKISLNNSQVGILKNTILQNIGKQNISKLKKDRVIKEVNELINQNTTKNGMSGVNFKKFETDLGNLSLSYKRATGGDILLSRIVNDAKKDANTILLSANPSSQLSNLNKAKVGMSVVQIATNKANKNQGIFSTSQFLDALKQNDKSFLKKSTARGEGFLRQSADEAQEVIGNYLPDSGTASRLVTGNISVEPLKALQYAPATVVSELAYGGLTRTPVRGLLQVPTALSAVTRPTTSGLLGASANEALQNRGILR